MWHREAEGPPQEPGRARVPSWGHRGITRAWQIPAPGASLLPRVKKPAPSHVLERTQGLKARGLKGFTAPWIHGVRPPTRGPASKILRSENSKSTFFEKVFMTTRDSILAVFFVFVLKIHHTIVTLHRGVFCNLARGTALAVRGVRFFDLEISPALALWSFRSWRLYASEI